MKRKNLPNAFLLALTGFSLAQASPTRAGEVDDALRGLAPKEVAAETCPRIVGGTCTTQKEWPWQVALYFRMRDGHKAFTCGGSLIAPGWVLSAAHCFGAKTSAQASDWTVLDDVQNLSIFDPAANATQTAVKRVVVHEGYDPRTQANDIALVELASPLSAKTIELLSSPDPSLEAKGEATITGWGMTRWLEPKTDDQGHTIGFVDGETKEPVPNPERFFASSELREVTLPLVDVAECARDNQNLHGNGSIDQRNLCAGFPQGGKDSCYGDSGGPMMVETATKEWRQIGIVSWGIDSGCARPGRPGVYTRVSQFSDWIKGKLNGEPSPPQPQPQPQPSPSQESAVLDNSADLTIAFDKGDDVNVGDLVSYVVSARQSGYLTILDDSPECMLTQVYPNAASLRSPTGAMLTSRIEPNRPLAVPNYRNPYRGFAVQIQEPRGEGTMVAVLSDRPLTSVDIPRTPVCFESKSKSLAVLSRLQAELASRMKSAAESGAAAPWSFAIRKYVVH